MTITIKPTEFGESFVSIYDKNGNLVITKQCSENADQLRDIYISENGFVCEDYSADPLINYLYLLSEK